MLWLQVTEYHVSYHVCYIILCRPDCVCSCVCFQQSADWWARTMHNSLIPWSPGGTLAHGNYASWNISLSQLNVQRSVHIICWPCNEIGLVQDCHLHLTTWRTLHVSLQVIPLKCLRSPAYSPPIAIVASDLTTIKTSDLNFSQKNEHLQHLVHTSVWSNTECQYHKCPFQVKKSSIKDPT